MLLRTLKSVLKGDICVFILFDSLFVHTCHQTFIPTRGMNQRRRSSPLHRHIVSPSKISHNNSIVSCPSSSVVALQTSPAYITIGLALLPAWQPPNRIKGDMVRRCSSLGVTDVISICLAWPLLSPLSNPLLFSPPSVSHANLLQALGAEASTRDSLW